MQVKLLYGVLEKEDIITRSAEISNCGNCGIVVEKAASACLDFVTGDYDMLSFWGRHAMERNLQRREIAHGSFCIGSRRGTSSHQYNPAVILAGENTTEEHGSCYGMVFVYSGNFMCEAEKDQFGQTRVLMGLQSDLFHYPLEQGETLVIPETILGYTDKGLGQLSIQFHRCIMGHNGVRRSGDRQEVLWFGADGSRDANASGAGGVSCMAGGIGSQDGVRRRRSG